MAWRVRAPSTKPDLCLIPRAPVEEESHLSQIVFGSPSTLLAPLTPHK